MTTLRPCDSPSGPSSPPVSSARWPGGRNGGDHGPSAGVGAECGIMESKRKRALASRFDRPMTDGYWAMMELRNAYLGQPTPALDWPQPHLGDPLCESERAILDHVRGAERLLDVGAGDLRTQTRLQAAGFSGEYHTTDRSPEFEYTYQELADVPDRSYDAVLVLEVIEHIPLADFDAFMDQVLRVLKPGGKLVISTPNAGYVGTIWEADMTHVHAYRLQDLAAYLHLRGVPSTVYRVAWRSPVSSFKERLRVPLWKALTRWVLQLDYARGTLVLGTREAPLATATTQSA
jgi:SAM-dependent methyltransferase